MDASSDKGQAVARGIVGFLLAMSSQCTTCDRSGGATANIVRARTGPQPVPRRQAPLYGLRLRTVHCARYGSLSSASDIQFGHEWSEPGD